MICHAVYIFLIELNLNWTKKMNNVAFYYCRNGKKNSVRLNYTIYTRANFFINRIFSSIRNYNRTRIIG